MRWGTFGLPTRSKAEQMAASTTPFPVSFPVHSVYSTNPSSHAPFPSHPIHLSFLHSARRFRCANATTLVVILVLTSHLVDLVKIPIVRFYGFDMLFLRSCCGDFRILIFEFVSFGFQIIRLWMIRCWLAFLRGSLRSSIPGWISRFALFVGGRRFYFRLLVYTCSTQRGLCEMRQGYKCRI
jgi:hypothetical protein